MMRSALAKAILKEFPAADVYKEPQTQNTAAEAFYITQRKIEQEPQVTDVIKRTYFMQVRFEQKIDAKQQLQRAAEVAEILLIALRQIELDVNEFINGDNLNYEIVDSILLFYCDYTMRIIDPTLGIEMENLEEIENLKGGY